MKKLLLGTVLSAALLLVASQDARASIDINSSMTATCIGSGCEIIQFDLNLTPDDYLLDHIVLDSQDAAWEFGSLQSVLDSEGNDVTDSWASGVNADELELKASNLTGYSAEPLSITVGMNSWGSIDEISGNLAYSGSGTTSDGETNISFEGSVQVPEPASTVLLGTGLFGLAALAGRRREHHVKDEGDAEAMEM